MKKRVLPLLLAALLCLTGCGSFLQREWYEVKDHSPNSYESNGRDALQADTYQDLVNNILILVGNHTAEGTIWLYYAQENLDVEVAMEQACREVEHETPVGSYAVEYLQYTVDDTARNYSEIKITIGYRRSEEQLAAITHVTNPAALRDMQARLYAMRASALYARADCGAILRAGGVDNLAQAAEIAGADAGLLYQQDAVDTLLRQEERAVVIHVLHAVCNGSAEEQAAAFDYALERMAELCRQAEQKRDAQSRLFASLGALSGACALMILW